MATQKKKTSAKKPVTKKVAVKKTTVKKTAPKKTVAKKPVAKTTTTKGKARGPYKKSEAQRQKEAARRLERELAKAQTKPEPKIEKVAKEWVDEDFDYLDHPRKEESGLLGLAIIGAIVIILVGIIWLLAK